MDNNIAEVEAMEVPDHAGESYVAVLDRLHTVLRPKTYFEIGVFSGFALQLARCAAIGVDPRFDFNDFGYIKGIINKPELHLYQMGSDDFFAARSPTAIFGRPIDMAFLDGMHRCEFLLRDFTNTEKHCRQNSIIGLHDCLPLEVSMTGRSHNTGDSLVPHRAAWWTGDVWRTVLALKRRRPDLSITCLDATQTGLVLITNLDPRSTTLQESYRDIVGEMLSWDLSDLGVTRLFRELNVESTTALATNEAITARFWL